MRAIRFASCVLMLVFASSAAPSPITFAFAGAVTDDPFGLTFFGAPISGSITFDSTAIDTIAGPQTGAFRSTGAGYDFRAIVDGTAYAVLGNVTVDTANNIGVDQYGAIGSGGGLTLELFFEDSTQTALASDALPLVPPPLSGFAFRQFRLFSDDAEFLGSVSALVCTAGCATRDVPEPGALALAGLASLMLLGARPRHRSR
jgi:hypothetical protein